MDRDSILKLTVEKLKEKLVELGLSTSGRKQSLQDRLLDHFGYTEPESDAEFVEASMDSGSVAQPVKPVFTLRDVRDSVNLFTGTKSPEIENWLTEFEDCATAVQWDETQKFIFARQLLRGAAQTFVRSQTNITVWSELKKILLKEFGCKLSTADIHKILSNRKKFFSESYLEYLYKLMDIAKPLKLEEKSIIEYFADGIKDSRVNKTIFYEASTFEELKAKIKIYEKINKKSDGNSYEKFSRNFETDKKCINCPNFKNHTTQECRKHNFVCRSCNQKGHRSSECTNTQNRSRNNNFTPRGNTNSRNNYYNQRNNNNNFSNNNFPTNEENIQGRLVQAAVRIFKNVLINDFSISFLLDTGSDICFITKTIFDSLKNVKLIQSRATIEGIGQQQIRTLGYITTTVTIDNCNFECIFHIAEDKDIAFQSMLGNDILKKVNINLYNGFAKFSIKDEKIIEENSVEDLGIKKIEACDNNFKAGLEFRSLCTTKNINQDSIVEENTLHLNFEDKNKIQNLVLNYQPFKREESPIKMKIILKDDIPVYQRPRRLPITDQKWVENQITDWIEAGIVKSSTSEYASPILLVNKKDGSKRLCCDYRKLNDKIIKDNFPMILIDDVVTKLQKAKVFTTLDLKNGFFHVPIEYNSRKFTSFVTHHGQFEFCKVPFGISNSPAVFCRYIAAILQPLILSNTIIVYMDDIVIPSENKEENIKKLSQVFNIAEKHGLQINWKKCQFLQTEITFLGYIIKNGTIKPSLHKTNAVSNYSVPKNQKQIQRFLGLTSYFRRFIENYAQIARPLTNLLCKNATFKFNEEHELAFKQLKFALINAPILKIFNQFAQTEIHCDASKYGYGATLMQKDSEDEKWHPVEYMSRKTTPTQQNYHSYELEVLAIIEALKKWRCYILGIPIKIVTDCNAFAQTVNKQEVPTKIARWILFLQDFNFVVEHRSGNQLKHVDALSRVYSMMIQGSLKQRIINAQDSDEFIKTIKELLKNGIYKDFFIKYDLLYKDPNKELIVVPNSMQKEIIETAHKQGHFSSKKTEEIINKNFYIDKITSKTENIVKNCIQCIIANTKNGKKEGLLNTVNKPDRPLHTFHVDHVGPLENTKKQYNHIFTIIDSFSKFIWLYPTKSTGSDEVIDKLTKQATIFGNPSKIISDRGTAFTSNSFQEYCKTNNIDHHLITTGVPRENGQVERAHKIVLSILTKLCLENPTHWYKHVNKVQQIINNTPTRSTKFSPFKILTGVDMNLANIHKIKELLDEEEIEELNNNREEIRTEAKNNILKIQNENRKTFNKNRIKENEYNVGDLVAIKRTQFGSGLKLKGKFLGPYKIVEKKRLGRYIVEKIGESEGPKKTSTLAEYMKPWVVAVGTTTMSE